MEKEKFEYEMLKIYIATIKKIYWAVEKNANACKDFRLRWLSLIVLVEAEQNH